MFSKKRLCTFIVLFVLLSGIACKKNDSSILRDKAHLSYSGKNEIIKIVTDQLKLSDSLEESLLTTVKDDVLLWEKFILIGKVSENVSPDMYVIIPYVNADHVLNGYLKFDLRKNGAIIRMSAFNDKKLDSVYSTDAVYKRFGALGLKLNKSSLEDIKSNSVEIIPDATVMRNGCYDRFDIYINVDSWSCGITEFNNFLKLAKEPILEELRNQFGNAHVSAEGTFFVNNSNGISIGQMLAYNAVNNGVMRFILNMPPQYGICGQGFNFRLSDFVSTCENDTEPAPAIQLPNLDVSELDAYPEFKKLCIDLPNFLNKYPNVVKALSYTTGFTEAEVKQLMQPGKGPKVVVVANLQGANGQHVQGHYDGISKILQIDNAYVNGLDIVKSPVRYQAIGLMLTMTTLHEFVHFGRDANNLPIYIPGSDGVKLEAGWFFEDAIAPGDLDRIEPSNAIEWLKYYTIKPRF